MDTHGRILIVEDEEKIARFLELELTHEGYEVGKAADGRCALDMALASTWDLILLDVMLPQLNGLEVLRRVRRESDVPVILLTARDAVMDKVSGLDAGANDYITKPFAIEELLARIRVILRTRPVRSGVGESGAVASQGGSASASQGASSAPAIIGSSASGSVSASTTAADKGVLRAGQVTLDPSRRLVHVGGTPVELTMREFEVLRVLMENKDIVLSREKIANLACGYDYMGETNIVDVYVRHLRAKIDDRFGIKLVSTVRGVGYVVREGLAQREGDRRLSHGARFSRREEGQPPPGQPFHARQGGPSPPHFQARRLYLARHCAGRMDAQAG